MQKIKTLLLLLVVISLMVTACTKVEREYYPNGRLKSEIHYRNGIENGMMTYYHENYNSKELEVNMKNGKKNGQCIRYFFNGKIESVAYYEEDIITGVEQLFDLRGNLIMETHYVNGVKEGPYHTWFEKNLPKEVGAYKNDKFDGKWEYYDDRGCIVGNGDFHDGNGSLTAYDANGNVARITTYAGNFKNGNEIYFSPNGDTVKVLLFKNDRIIAVNGENVDLKEE